MHMLPDLLTFMEQLDTDLNSITSGSSLHLLSLNRNGPRTAERAKRILCLLYVQLPTCRAATLISTFFDLNASKFVRACVRAREADQSGWPLGYLQTYIRSQRCFCAF